MLLTGNVIIKPLSEDYDNKTGKRKAADETGGIDADETGGIDAGEIGGIDACEIGGIEYKAVLNASRISDRI